MIEKILDKWINKDAHWYHFWLPQSGFIGGAVAAVVLTTVVLILISL